MESNISRDHIALEAMKIVMHANIVNQRTIWDIIKCAVTGKGGVSKARCISPERAANLAYQYADAMIAEMEKPTNSYLNRENSLLFQK
jgi:hypothetical protein